MAEPKQHDREKCMWKRVRKREVNGEMNVCVCMFFFRVRFVRSLLAVSF